MTFSSDATATQSLNTGAARRLRVVLKHMVALYHMLSGSFLKVMFEKDKEIWSRAIHFGRNALAQK